MILHYMHFEVTCLVNFQKHIPQKVSITSLRENNDDEKEYNQPDKSSQGSE